MDPESLVGDSSFIAAFASTNLGDVSPNILGPKCIDTGLPCDVEHSTCNNRTQMCIASGPGVDMFDSTRIIAERQFNAAYDLFAGVETAVEVSGPVQFVHQWVDMTNYQVTLPDGNMVHTCKPALGYSFAAGRGLYNRYCDVMNTVIEIQNLIAIYTLYIYFFSQTFYNS